MLMTFRPYKGHCFHFTPGEYNGKASRMINKNPLRAIDCKLRQVKLLTRKAEITDWIIKGNKSTKENTLDT